MILRLKSDDKSLSMAIDLDKFYPKNTQKKAKLLTRLVNRYADEETTTAYRKYIEKQLELWKRYQKTARENLSKQKVGTAIQKMYRAELNSADRVVKLFTVVVNELELGRW
ncbi:hypothetical protein [Blautia producta]|uniref:hypothetical protein n=1 Tax=Blautia producta TaxID=33035 RepID=UPI0031B5D559